MIDGRTCPVFFLCAADAPWPFSVPAEVRLKSEPVPPIREAYRIFDNSESPFVRRYDAERLIPLGHDDALAPLKSLADSIGTNTTQRTMRRRLALLIPQNSASALSPNVTMCRCIQHERTDERLRSC